MNLKVVAQDDNFAFVLMWMHRHQTTTY
uniref:Uncharacterized protein n=1 Tax=Arundo donax TaxID=35708 RepID=A0A0A9BNT3_ARUDO